MPACQAVTSSNTTPVPVEASFRRLTVGDLESFKDVYSAVRTLRSSWLASRSNSSQQVRIFVDGILTPWIDALASIPIHEVLEVRYLTASEATVRYGGGALGGAIVVTTRR